MHGISIVTSTQRRISRKKTCLKKITKGRDGKKKELIIVLNKDSINSKKNYRKKMAKKNINTYPYTGCRRKKRRWENV